MLRSRSPVVRGALAGAAGAALLALFFLAVDAVRGTPLQTPSFLAATSFGVSGVSAGLLALYTVIHFLAFVAIGIAVAWLLDAADMRPHLLLGPVLGILLFDLLFYAGVVVTGVNVVTALGWPAVLVGNLLAGIAVIGVLQLTAAPGTPSWRESFRLSRLAQEGVVAGLVGATMVASWFLVIDALQGRLFFTPAALGSILLLGVQDPAAVEVGAGIVAAYTALHFTAFIALGLLASALAARAERHEHVLLGAVLLFVTMEVFVIGMIAIAASWLLSEVPWWSIAVANVLAAIVMGTYLWREHPMLHEVLNRQSLEEPELKRA
jgi:hypothetical protein